MNFKKIFHELKHHIPFTFIATLMAVIFVLVIQFVLKIHISEMFFYVLHPAHLFFSAIVTVGIYYKYKKNFINAILIGLFGSIIIGSLSDIIFPWLGGTALNLETEFHFLLIEEPFLVISTALFGSVIGVVAKTTKFPHFIHVLLSIFASLFYLMAFSSNLNLIFFAVAFLIVFVAVLIPCCLSDIIFPLIFVKKR